MMGYVISSGLEICKGIVGSLFRLYLLFLSDSNSTTNSIFLICLAILFMRSIFHSTSSIFRAVSVTLVNLLPSGSQIV